MVSALVRPGRQLAKRLLLLQSGVVLATAILAAFAVNIDWGISAFIGGGIFIVAQAVFACCAFMFSGARKARLVMASFYGGEVLKILITVILFAVVYLYTEVDLLPLKLTYLLALGINIFGPVLFINNNK
ncbi:TPA: F0F1 ATP synthase subunit I [Photobacterium damselae]|uniref:F0F1 ATP synthase subunit I n=3 Tax=Photobacterium damselae TaxID=38293 RepID=A0A1V1V706_PHODP|nr:F0F1 ATP synthase subunit I [Photobacterium damselae]EHA1082153.1 F0F1 ATP synthase subunit I [Photobacterium damselae]ELI6448965.1 F0F1 ATP synthase subunit I [Photobacterium damselae]KAB1512704.1 F0F1 ATP synthase subunit I [Photobacterium damselae subsp. damselae]MBA5684855.1 F0F1 ATP synthase subunit I [Photobacterium damselae subsp. damselae]MBE8127956.1 F0F1 ATP synthase subunit I [Photobacterium damselae subsp. piscicida]